MGKAEKKLKKLQRELDDKKREEEFERLLKKLEKSPEEGPEASSPEDTPGSGGWPWSSYLVGALAAMALVVFTLEPAQIGGLLPLIWGFFWAIVSLLNFVEGYARRSTLNVVESVFGIVMLGAPYVSPYIVPGFFWDFIVPFFGGIPLGSLMVLVVLAIQLWQLLPGWLNKEER